MNKETKIFKVLLHGDYTVRSGSGNVLRTFGPVELKIPNTWDRAYSHCRFKLIPALIQQADPDFGSLRICVIDSITHEDGSFIHDLPVKYMGRKQIAEIVRQKGIPLLVDMYPDIIELRRRFEQAMKAPKKFAEEEMVEIEKHKGIVDTIKLNKDVFDNVKLDAPHKLPERAKDDVGIPMDSDQTEEQVAAGAPMQPAGVTDEFPSVPNSNLPPVKDVTNKKPKAKRSKIDIKDL